MTNKDGLSCNACKDEKAGLIALQIYSRAKSFEVWLFGDLVGLFSALLLS
jgi:hypothetical protein